MEKKTVRQFSLLGLALMGVSALTAAIAPSKAAPAQVNSVNNGTIRQFSGGDGAVQAVVSCINAGNNTACHLTNSGTTIGAGTLIATDDGGLYDTQGNTSLSRTLLGGDTTSVLVKIN